MCAAWCFAAYAVMAHIVMCAAWCLAAYAVMAHIVMAYVVMAHIVMCAAVLGGMVLWCYVFMFRGPWLCWVVWGLYSYGLYSYGLAGLFGA